MNVLFSSLLNHLPTLLANRMSLCSGRWHIGLLGCLRQLRSVVRIPPSDKTLFKKFIYKLFRKDEKISVMTRLIKQLIKFKLYLSVDWLIERLSIKDSWRHFKTLCRLIEQNQIVSYVLCSWIEGHGCRLIKGLFTHLQYLPSTCRFDWSVFVA